MLVWRDPAPQASNPLVPLGLPPLVSAILLRRGINTPAAALAFLDPQQAPAASPFDLPGMETACGLLQTALERGQRILIWGDFDVDGQTATAILLETLTSLGAEVSFYIPSRERESHGIRPASLQALLEQRRPQLLLTCDTGIAAHDGLELAQRCGLTVIVTDHHELPPNLPPAQALVNPRFLPPEHPQASLTGAGVAFQLARALAPGLAPALLDLTALGLIADVALLTGETRRLVQQGLQALRSTSRPGLLALMQAAGSPAAQMTETGVGFALAPRLNALGRLAEAAPAVELLTTRDPQRARVLAEQLESLNQQRRFLTRQVISAAEGMLRNSPDDLTAPAILLHNPAWPPGVIGIAANALAERYHKPVILFCGQDSLRGSARSAPGIHITRALEACSLPASTFGGHPMAAGLSLAAQEWPAFRRRFFRAVEAAQAEAALAAPLGELQLDAWLSLEDLTLELAAALEPLAPFGAGNPAPVFAARNLRLAQDVKGFGKTGEHRKLRAANANGVERELFWWGGAEEETPPEVFDAAFTLRAVTWRGQRQLNLELQDWRPAQTPAPLEVASLLQWVDERAAADPLERLQAWQQQQPEALLWAEGEHKSLPQARSRLALSPVETLLLWSTPPSQAALRQILEKTQPRRVIVFAQRPAALTAMDFVRQLAGLLKSALKRRAGLLTVEELASALGAAEAEVLSGLMWLEKQGKLLFSREAGGSIRLQAVTLPAQEPANGPTFQRLQKNLQETEAYRAVFARRRLE